MNIVEDIATTLKIFLSYYYKMNITELELKFKKYNKYYYYELCCPTIVNLYNECPSDSIGILLKKCFKIGDTIFKNKHIKIQYTNLTSNEPGEINKSIDNCLNIKLNTDPVEKNNKLCIKKLLLQVVPNCLNINEQQTRNTSDIQTVSFNSMGTMVVTGAKSTGNFPYGENYLLVLIQWAQWL